MKRVLITVAATALVALGAVAFAGAQAPGEVPFPAPSTDVFVYATTTTATGEASNYFLRGQTVVFNAFAADVKTKRVVTDTTARFFYVKIPNQPNLKLSYGKVGQRLLWTGRWTIPADYPLGVVNFKVLVKTKAKRYGSFVQPGVVPAMLTVTASL